MHNNALYYFNNNALDITDRKRLILRHAPLHHFVLFRRVLSRSPCDARTLKDCRNRIKDVCSLHVSIVVTVHPNLSLVTITYSCMVIRNMFIIININ